ncbi:MAG TPA: hypothetical protein DGN59_17180 [Candidatus Latescibacteria bacterium]|jgi:uroporphyrinogen-III decarboxylase|nr:hypothetical protein [Candidatus Latescibacterota bacterium]
MRRRNRGDGYIVNAIHGIQSKTPIENILAMFETVERNV